MHNCVLKCFVNFSISLEIDDQEDLTISNNIVVYQDLIF